MTVGQLIEKLKNYDPGLKICLTRPGSLVFFFHDGKDMGIADEVMEFEDN